MNTLITDSTNIELTFWPISMVEGTNSEQIVFKVDTDTAGLLKAELDSRMNVWVRPLGSGGSYTNISSVGLPVGIGITQWEIYVQALSPITGLARIPLSISVGTSHPAAW